MVFTFGLPVLLRNDPGTEFTAEVVENMCQWLNVSINHGPVDHARAQGTAERLGGWLHDTLGELCKAWPRQWDKYVRAAVWITTWPDSRLPGNATPFCIVFGRDPRTQFDALHPKIDADSFRGGLHNYVTDQGGTRSKESPTAVTQGSAAN